MSFQIITGDINKIQCDAIVNATNKKGGPMNNPEEKTALTPIEITREADYLRETLENGMPAFPTSDFLNRCSLDDCLKLLELIPFDVSLNLPYRQRKPLYLTKVETRQLQQVGLYARCFGSFELFCDGKPVSFQRRQTKELFAYLIDRRGACVTSEELSAALWEDSDDLVLLKHRIRNLVSDLKSTLTKLGHSDILDRGRDRIGLAAERIACDYYRHLNGTAGPQEAFRGEYMEQYSWAEATKGALYFGEM